MYLPVIYKNPIILSLLEVVTLNFNMVFKIVDNWKIAVLVFSV